MSVRTVDQLFADAHAVMRQAEIRGATEVRRLFSGGHDSLCAAVVASEYKSFYRGNSSKVVHHIKTGIGAAYTLEFVERVCRIMDWELKVWQSPSTYEQIVMKYGFPGPGAHRWPYSLLKDRCVSYMTRGKAKKMLVTGSRSQESVRRMGHVEPVHVGDWSVKKCRQCRASKRRGGVCPHGACRKVLVKLGRVWTAPCHDWSKAEQQHFMDELGLPINKLKVAMGMSGECFCGAFAAPGELDRIRQFAPDVAAEIDRLTEIAKAHGKPCVWGHRPAGEVATIETGPLCSSCDQRAASTGLLTINRS